MVATWSAGEDPQAVYFTMLPPGYQQDLQCCKGDMDNDSEVTGYDVSYFVSMLLGGDGHPDYSYLENFCRADMNGDGVIDTHYDILYFVDSLYYSNPICPNLDYLQRAFDCDNNGLNDAEEIAANPSLDCNGNGFLDECDLALGAGYGSTDCNQNGIPDECDVNSQTSSDCNLNGVPDECDIASGTSPDRDHDGIPDECALMEFNGPSGGGLDCADEPEDLEAAWAEFYLWAAQQNWGPASGLSGAEQYQLIVDKKCELGLLYLTP